MCGFHMSYAHIHAPQLSVPKPTTFCPQSSYAEVRAEQRRELGIEESNPEVAVDKVRNYY